jgi:ATP-dependent RNA helicase RhlE
LTSFNDLGLAEPFLRALSEEKYTQPTPIQAQTIPYALAGRDIVGIAQTGTGKTAAFALPILQRLSANKIRPERKSCRVLVLSPTRELSGQIQDSFITYGRHTRPSVTLAIGGVPIGRQQRAMSNGVDVLVATPGRLLDLVRMGSVKLDLVEIVVLDEADRMLDMGFIHDIRKIVAKLPHKRQSLFFSATMPKEIEDLASGFLRDPARVAVTPVATTAEKVDQRVIHVDRAGKQGLLAEVLKSEKVDRALVFTRTKHGADKVVRGLVKSGIAAEAIHGNKSQNQRDRVLAQFRSGEIRTLVATDIAARGIDVDGVSHVINYDLPNMPESYVHRIGRTARAGAEGIAISFCDGEERAFLRDIEKLIRMSIAATDRRGQALPAQPEGERTDSPRQGRGNGHQRAGQRPGGQRPGGRPAQAKGHHAAGRPNGGQRAEEQPDGGPTRTKRRRRPQRGGQAAQEQRPAGWNPLDQRPDGQAQRARGNGRPHHPEPAAAAHHDDIASVAFLRRKPREDAPAQA